MSAEDSDPTTDTLQVGTAPTSQLLDLAHSVRSFAAQMVRVDGHEEQVEAVRAELDRLTGELVKIARPGDTPQVLPSMDADHEDHRPYYPASGDTWHANPVFPPLEIETEGNVVRGSLELGLEYEGPPDCIHGGVVSMIFDQLLGHANGANGTYGMTAKLEVSYHVPTPLYTALDFEAQVKHVDGRKITTEGWIAANGTKTASAVGLFVRPEWRVGGGGDRAG